MVPARIVPAVVREHAELAAFQWAQRDTLSHDDPPEPIVIAGIDKRLEANLDGLRIAGAAAWPFIIDQHEDYPENGELFVVAVRALEEGDPRRIEQALAFARVSPEARGFVGALAWLPPSVTRGPVREWLASADALERWLGASALVELGVDPGGLLGRLLADPDPRVRGRAYCLAAKCPRADALDQVRAGLTDPDETARFWAAWAAVELGASASAADPLKAVVVAGNDESLRALRTVIKAGPDADVRRWLSGLLQSPETAPIAVRAAGMLADHTLVGWLVRQMRVPGLARPAWSAFRELFPEADEDELTTIDRMQLGEAFREPGVDDDGTPIVVADRVWAWVRDKARSGRGDEALH